MVVLIQASSTDLVWI